MRAAIQEEDDKFFSSKIALLLAPEMLHLLKYVPWSCAAKGASEAVLFKKRNNLLDQEKQVSPPQLLGRCHPINPMRACIRLTVYLKSIVFLVSTIKLRAENLVCKRISLIWTWRRAGFLFGKQL
jgi:hypothetical protein